MKRLLFTFTLYGILLINSGCEIENQQVIRNPENWSILLGDGMKKRGVANFEHQGFFFQRTTVDTSWVSFKAPNGGTTSRTSNNTRSELGELQKWTPQQGGELRATLKVMHVSKSGNPYVPASYSTVIGQIHSVDGHENEPLKIFYKKFPGHEYGSVFWNYEINTEGDNGNRWDYSIPIWGYDMSVTSDSLGNLPADPLDGIKLGETFSYEVLVEQGIMTLIFTSKGHETKRFTKSLIATSFGSLEAVPAQVIDLYTPLGRSGYEKATGYLNEKQIFKVGCYNQSNGKSPSTNSVWHTGSNTENGNISKQYERGDFAEVWFSNIDVEHK
jgi:hypothetical protein